MRFPHITLNARVLTIDEGSVEKRAAAVIIALSFDWPLVESALGAILVDPQYDRVYVVPADVMQHLIDAGAVQIQRELPLH